MGTSLTGVSGRDCYANLYLTQLEAEAEWLRRGALDKADSVEQLLARNGIVPRTLTELGAGTGAVISECRRRGLGQTFTAVEDAAAAFAYLRKNFPDIPAIKADITSLDFQLEGPVDVLVISHVVEHLEQPKVFLESVRRLKFKAAIIEVPLEDLPLARYKSWINHRRENTAGHVQFFTAGSFERLVTSAGLKIVDRRTTCQSRPSRYSAIRAREGQVAALAAAADVAYATAHAPGESPPLSTAVLLSLRNSGRAGLTSDSKDGR